MELIQVLKRELNQELRKEICQELRQETHVLINGLRQELREELHKETHGLINGLRKEMHGLINDLREEIDTIKENKKEIYYQRFLEKMLGSGHNITKYGITDITTDTQHIEIKCWKNYKNCMGQLLAYNHKDTKQMVAAFYDEPGKIYKDKEKVIELLKSNNIDTWEMIKTPYGIEIKKYQCDNNIKKDTDNFYDWLEEHIHYKKNNITKLKDIVELYVGKSVGSRTINPFRKDIEKYIKKNFKNMNYNYQNTTFEGISYRGWLHIGLKL